MDDAFLEALQHAIKEEIVQNYFHARRVVEEEIAEVNDWVKAQTLAAEKVKKVLGRLKSALIEPRFWDEFWRLVRSRPRPGVMESCSPEAPNPAGLGGLTRGSRYQRLLRQTVRDLARALNEHEAILSELTGLIEEVNSDIDRFHKNFDFLALSAVINALDPQVMERKHFLGSAVEGEACLSMEERLRFKKLNLALDKMKFLEPLPSHERLDQAAKKAAREVLRAASEKVKALLKGQG